MDENERKMRKRIILPLLEINSNVEALQIDGLSNWKVLNLELLLNYIESKMSNPSSKNDNDLRQIDWIFKSLFIQVLYLN